MRIDSKEQIADVEILKVRDLLRRVNNTDEWEADFVVVIVLKYRRKKRIDS